MICFLVREFNKVKKQGVFPTLQLGSKEDPISGALRTITHTSRTFQNTVACRQEPFVGMLSVLEHANVKTMMHCRYGER